MKRCMSKIWWGPSTASPRSLAATRLHRVPSAASLPRQALLLAPAVCTKSREKAWSCRSGPTEMYFYKFFGKIVAPSRGSRRHMQPGSHKMSAAGRAGRRLPGVRGLGQAGPGGPAGGTLDLYNLGAEMPLQTTRTSAATLFWNRTVSGGPLQRSSTTTVGLQAFHPQWAGEFLAGLLKQHTWSPNKWSHTEGPAIWSLSFPWAAL